MQASKNIKLCMIKKTTETIKNPKINNLFSSINISLYNFANVIYELLEGEKERNKYFYIRFKIYLTFFLSYNCIRRKKIIFCFPNWKKKGDTMLNHSEFLKE